MIGPEYDAKVNIKLPFGDGQPCLEQVLDSETVGHEEDDDGRHHSGGIHMHQVAVGDDEAEGAIGGTGAEHFRVPGKANGKLKIPVWTFRALLDYVTKPSDSRRMTIQKHL